MATEPWTWKSRVLRCPFCRRHVVFAFRGKQSLRSPTKFELEAAYINDSPTSGELLSNAHTPAREAQDKDEGQERGDG